MEKLGRVKVRGDDELNHHHEPSWKKKFKEFVKEEREIVTRLNFSHTP